MDVILVSGLALAFAGATAASAQPTPVSVPFQQHATGEQKTLFSLVPPDQTGIAAVNKI
jgi:hypothetical protein